MSTEAPPRRTRFDRWLLGGWIVAISVALAGTVHDTDPYWQIRAGQETLQGLALARPDTWSWAPVDGLFYPNSPAWNVLLAVSWDGLGSWGLFLVTALTIGACLLLTSYLAFRLGARTVQVVVVLLVTSAAVLPIMTPRPALAAQTLFLLAVAAAAWWSDRAARHGVALNAAVVLISGLVLSGAGNWIHLSWSTLAVATAAAWAIIWLLTRGLARILRLVLVVSGSVGLVVGILLGPYGTDVAIRSTAVVDACRDLIVEWSSPFSPEFGLRWWPLAVAVGLVIVGAAVWLARMVRRSGLRDRRLPLGVALTVVAVPYAAAGFLFLRFIPVAILSLAPIVAAAFTALTTRWHARATTAAGGTGYFRRRLPEWTSDRFWRVILTMVLVVLAPLAVFAGSRHAEPATQGVNDALPRGCRMFGGSIEAASIILTRPDVHVWIDGRADYWGRDRIIESDRYLYDVNQPTLVPPGTTCVVLRETGSEPELQRLTDALDADAAWTRVPGTSGANLWVPSSPEGALS